MWFLIIDTTSCAARFVSASKSKPFSNTTFKSTNVLPAASLPSSVCFNLHYIPMCFLIIDMSVVSWIICSFSFDEGYIL